MPIVVRELLTLYGGGRAGAGDAVPGSILAWLSPGRIAPQRWRRGGGAGGAGGWHASGGARSVGREAVLPEQHWSCAQRGADVCADAAGARAGSDAEHLRPGGVGDPAGSRLTGRNDVVFGVDGGGASAGDPGIESMVGCFINTLPLRVKLAAEQPLLALLHEVQERQSRLMAHQHLGLTDIQEHAGIGDLFDTVVVVETYPWMPRLVGDCGRGAAQRRRRRRRHALSAEPGGLAGSAASAATRLSQRPTSIV